MHVSATETDENLASSVECKVAHVGGEGRHARLEIESRIAIHLQGARRVDRGEPRSVRTPRDAGDRHPARDDLRQRLQRTEIDELDVAVLGADDEDRLLRMQRRRDGAVAAQNIRPLTRVQVEEAQR